jgi:hypothetical protein
MAGPEQMSRVRACVRILQRKRAVRIASFQGLRKTIQTKEEEVAEEIKRQRADMIEDFSSLEGKSVGKNSGRPGGLPLWVRDELRNSAER